MINLSALKNFSRAKKYPRSTIIAGDTLSTELFIVLKGEVGVFINYHKQTEEMIATIGPGEFFGETGLLLEKSTPSTAVVLTDVIALPINRNSVISFIRDEPEMAFELMKAMCVRLDNVSIAYEKLNGLPWVENKSIPKETPPAPAAKTQESSPVLPVPSPVTQDPAQSSSFSLFPEGHGSYQLILKNEDRAYLMDKGYACPICRKEFKALQIRTSRLILDSTDSDMRHRYKGIEPLYYDVVTCPDCLYSALSEMFCSPENPKAELGELKAIKPEAKFMFGTNIDTCSVYAGYYLALLCAPKCFKLHHLATAKLLLKLSRIYQDCGDKQMEEKTAKRALDAYMYIYVNGDSDDPNQNQQLCIVIGELFLKLNDLKNARDFFFKAKINREGTPLLKNQAENRILDIRTIEGRA